jgi:hypothetical protein
MKPFITGGLPVSREIFFRCDVGCNALLDRWRTARKEIGRRKKKSEDAE